MQVWDVAHLRDEEFVEEVVDALGASTSANKSSVSRKGKEKSNTTTRIIEVTWDHLVRRTSNPAGSMYKSK